MTNVPIVIDVRFVFQEILKTKESRNLIKLTKINVSKYFDYIEKCGAADWIITSPQHYLTLSEEFMNKMETVMAQKEFEKIISCKDLIDQYVCNFLNTFI